MLKIKKTVAALLALGSCSVFAGTMGPTCLAGNVTVPCEKKGWEVGGQALYLQPIYSVNGATPAAIFKTDNTYGYTPYAQPSWAWGFMVDGAYHWGAGKDLTLSWYHVNHATVLGNQPYQDAAPNGNVPIVVTQNLSLHPQWDAANAEFGRRIDLDAQSNLRFYGGVQYARIVTSANGYIAQGDKNLAGGLVTNGTYLNINSNFNGFGPRGGLDLNYDLPYGFTAYAKGAGGLLVGSAGFTNERLGTVGVGGAISANTGSRTMLIPELEGKLGFKYHYQMPAWTKQTSPSDLTLDAGWMWVNYFEAQMMGTNESGRGAAVIPNRVDVNQTNFALQGLYFGLNWLGNI